MSKLADIKRQQKAKVIELMQGGLSQNQAALKAKLRPNKVTHWKRSDPEFKRAVDTLRIAWAKRWGYKFGRVVSP